MAFRNPVQIAQHAYSAGFRGTDLIRAVATAMAESSGRSDVVNGIGATGLWQINQPVHVKSHPDWTKEWLKDPDNNARAAYVLWKEHGWQPWNPSRAGQILYAATANAAVQTFLAMNPTSIPKQAGALADQAQSAVGSAVGSATGLGDLTKSGAQAVDALGKAGQWLSTPANWLRIMEVVGGTIMILVGLVVIGLPVAEQVVGVAGPAGKIKKVAKAVSK